MRRAQKGHKDPLVSSARRVLQVRRVRQVRQVLWVRQVRQVLPYAGRIMLTGHADLETAMDAIRRGGAPGTLYVIDPVLDEWVAPEAGEVPADAHGMNIVETFRFAKTMGARLPCVRLVGGEPHHVVRELEE